MMLDNSDRQNLIDDDFYEDYDFEDIIIQASS